MQAAAGDGRVAVDQHKEAAEGGIKLGAVDVVHGIARAVSGFIFTVQVKQKGGNLGITEAHGYAFHGYKCAPWRGVLVTGRGSVLSRLNGCQ
ncbi:hypothetical protein CLE01_22050 [Cryobacterium levicorallinum]|nr:hypothetical protein CLE01_22050 [Cryobacterium levicorallinum]